MTPRSAPCNGSAPPHLRGETALKKKPRGFTIADCNFDGTPRCFHCGAAFIASTPVKMDKKSVTATCQSCGCWTPFRRTA